MYTIADIRKITDGKFLSGNNPAAVIEHLLIDSRKLLFPASTLFFSLPGPRRQGSAFVQDLYSKGVRNFIVDDSFAFLPQDFEAANIIAVKDVFQALQQLTAQHRSQFHFPVMGITGSNGKTIVKEWLYQLLQHDFNIVRSPKSYNSQIGVPLSVWQMNAQHTLGIFEAGISMPGEMEKLEKVIMPGIGIFTNIGEAHSEGFENIADKINEKVKLFTNSGTVIYCKDEVPVDEAMLLLQQKNNTVLFTWGEDAAATLCISSIQIQPFNTVIKGVFKEKKLSISIPFTNDAAVKNAITCWCVLLLLNIDNELIQERMLQLKPVEMRLELKQGINNCSVINDSYSADITSLSIALDFLQQQQQHPKRTVIISDILQTGKTNAALYQQVADILQQKKINRLIGVGTEIIKYSDAFSGIPETAFFNSTAEFLQKFPAMHFYNESILLKGARLFEFEQISHLLEEKVHQTVLEINLNAITHNLNTYQQLLSPGVKLMAMVKAFSYGSGGFEIANLLQFHKVDYLAVAYADEGVELRKAGITLPIMVMNAEEVTYDVLVQHNLEPELFSFGILSTFEDYLMRNGIQNFPVHIKLDTGMRRLGFEQKDISALCNRLQTTSAFKIQSVFSHLAASDSALHDAFTNAQAKAFLEGCEQIQKITGYKFLRHLANTSAIHRHKNMQYDMIRLGIGLYGVDAGPAIQQQLKNVTTLKTTISQIKNIKAGESIGYNRKGVAAKDSVIATVRIGYADGYPRLLSNGVGTMLVNGKLAPVIGNVCMDMTMLDITRIDAQEGDEVIVFGAALPVSELAASAQSIPYEILTGISQRVKRVYFEE
ncbi:MAG: bifunctional UDP-N-acetylmuramoyl-tripeptide:D-alanyl-D-alanine ligase/alanine racemase [Chitinophagaceae bacterium]|nr:bifunctional UDP-N-acetylmuramoyl-tripeptide:D-alanyl-D-alanine ligase/alanine racemase [Chitinophagaceae bacterium]MBL0198623.1 bifunctional UDP-N-acetylmuramoyl-tripeptide:D-alanyl-D-alanine ligase/alanine racemase [Chitinophagaceae bacterium]